MLKIKLPQNWEKLILEEISKPHMKSLKAFLKEEYARYRIYPPSEKVFRAFSFKDFDEIKVVILGQDPYHTPGVANGLAFATNLNNPIPPSLKNIFVELKSDLGLNDDKGFTSLDQTLSHWAEQGVLLLNTTLTVRKGEANSHFGKGWEVFTDNIIKFLSDERNNLVFILWGANARSKKKIIDNQKHFIIESAHPSPLSAHNGFFGSKPFSKANEFLGSKGIVPIKWI